MKIITLVEFKDMLEGKLRKVGDTFEASEERAKVIEDAGYGRIIDAPAGDKPGEKPKAKTSRTKKK